MQRSHKTKIFAKVMKNEMIVCAISKHSTHTQFRFCERVEFLDQILQRTKNQNSLAPNTTVYSSCQWMTSSPLAKMSVSITPNMAWRKKPGLANLEIQFTFLPYEICENLSVCIVSKIYWKTRCINEYTEMLECEHTCGYLNRQFSKAAKWN